MWGKKKEKGSITSLLKTKQFKEIYLFKKDNLCNPVFENKANKRK